MIRPPASAALSVVSLVWLSLTPVARAIADWPVIFVDVAREAGLIHPSIYGGIDRKRFIIEANGAGVALLDYDRDGWLDAFVLSGTRLVDGQRRERTFAPAEAPTNRLYRNQRNGRFADVTDRVGLRRTGWASGVCGGDYDRDGWLDVFVTSYGRNVLYQNRGGARFEDATAKAGLARDETRWGSGCTFIDYDRDGDLDLFVANYLRFDLQSAPEPGAAANCFWKGIPVNCGPKGLPTETNLLFRNRGDGTFEDQSAASGIARVTGRYSMTAVAVDLDEDNWLDIYVATDSTAAILYRNNHDGTFTDVAVERGAAYNDLGNPQAGMGVAVGDFNVDGRFDLLKTHFADDIPALYRGLARGLFEDVATAAGLGVQNRHVEWGAGFPDLDNDGFPDLVYVTGSVYPEVEARLSQYPHHGPRVIFRNGGRERFEDVSAASGPGVAALHSSRGAAFGDIDNDGDVDMLIMNMNEPPSLLRNDVSNDHGWIQVQLEGVQSNRDGIGAIVRLTAGGRTQTQAVLSQASYYSVNDLRAHFGLGAATQADRIEVRWPSGGVDVVDNVTRNRVVNVREGSTSSKR